MKVVGIKKVQTRMFQYNESLRIQKTGYFRNKRHRVQPSYIIYLSTNEEEKKEEDFIEDILSYYTEEEADKEENTIKALERQIIECQETTRDLISKYIIQLETERGQVRKLNEMIKHQTKKIKSLKANQQEKSVNKLMYQQDEYMNSNDELLNVLVELQTIELIEKKKIIIELRQERKELLKKVHVLSGITMRESLDSYTAQSFDSSIRSSIDMLEEISTSSSSPPTIPITPPSSPPPKYPIPPIPRKNKNRKKQENTGSSSSFSKKLNTASFLIKSWKRRSTSAS